VRCGWRPGCRCWRGVADSRRLLAAAAGLTGAGERAVAMAPHLRAGPEALLRGDRFDLDALDDATPQAKGVVAELEAPRAQLEKVRGGPLEPGSTRPGAGHRAGWTRPWAGPVRWSRPSRPCRPPSASASPAGAVAKLTRDADLRWPDQDERRRYHQAVLATLWRGS